MKVSVLKKSSSFFLASTAALFAVSFANAAEVKLAQGILPPYGIKESKSGIEVDIIKAALAKKGHTLTVRFVPFGRMGKEFEGGKVTAATPLTPGSGIKAEYSDSHISYQNVATTLTEKGQKIGSIADLGNYKVVAFVKADVYLGEEFAKMAKANKNYREVGDQITQNKLLMKGRTDAVVGDIRIFKYYNKQISSQVKLKDVTYHEIFSPTVYHVAFKDAAVRDDFNAGLKEIKASGEYDKIIANYVSN